MKHEKIRKLLGAYHDKELNPESMKDVETHLKTCPKCRKEYSLLKKLEELRYFIIALVLVKSQNKNDSLFYGKSIESFSEFLL